MSEKQPSNATGSVNNQPNDKPERKGSFWSAFLSVVAAAFGVQSDKNRQKDFSSSSPWPYIVGGVVFTLVFIAILVTVVSMVLA